MNGEDEQMIRRHPKNQLSFPLTSTELKEELIMWKKRALDAESKLEKVEGGLDKALCSVFDHTAIQSDYGRYCNRCGEDLD